MKKGFTLIEMAIVLIIIGVIIGGILVGRSMLETVKIQRLIKDLLQYQAATVKFKEAYQYYPGDSPDFLPPGNGDNLLGLGASSPAFCASPNYSNTESLQFYSHLSQAEMLDKTYVSYAPVSCGGSMNDDYYSLAGVIAPYTELDSKAAAPTGGYLKFIISPNKTDMYGNITLSIIVSASYVIPMEKKLGYVVYSPSAVGLNNVRGQGMCADSFGSIVSCISNNAVWGSFYYFLAPI